MLEVGSPELTWDQRRNVRLLWDSAYLCDPPQLYRSRVRLHAHARLSFPDHDHDHDPGRQGCGSGVGRRNPCRDLDVHLSVGNIHGDEAMVSGHFGEEEYDHDDCREYRDYHDYHVADHVRSQTATKQKGVCEPTRMASACVLESSIRHTSIFSKSSLPIRLLCISW